jgi:DNA-binding response OmpR family regulator
MIKKALIVDDDELILTFLNTLLTRKFGLKVLTAKDGYSGLEALDGSEVDIIFLDIMMPNLDGIGFLEVMRKDSRYSHLPVVVISAVNQRETVAKLLQLGVKDYILKPLEFLRISEKLNDIFLEYD